MNQNCTKKQDQIQFWLYQTSDLAIERLINILNKHMIIKPHQHLMIHFKWVSFKRQWQEIQKASSRVHCTECQYGSPKCQDSHGNLIEVFSPRGSSAGCEQSECNGFDRKCCWAEKLSCAANFLRRVTDGTFASLRKTMRQSQKQQLTLTTHRCRGATYTNDALQAQLGYPISHRC